MAARLGEFPGQQFPGTGGPVSRHDAGKKILNERKRGMKIEGEAELLRIFIGESDKRGAKPLYEVIVEEARKRGLAGATVLHGVLGFGANSRIHTAKILRLSEDLPVIIEIVD